MKLFVKRKSAEQLIKSFTESALIEVDGKSYYVLTETQHEQLQKALSWGKQRSNVKYLRRYWEKGRWNYVYAEDEEHFVKEGLGGEGTIYKNMPRELKIDVLRKLGTKYETTFTIGLDTESKVFASALRAKLKEVGVNIGYGMAARSAQVEVSKLAPLLTDPTVTVKVAGKDYPLSDLIVMSDRAAEIMQEYVDMGKVAWAEQVINSSRLADGELTLSEAVAEAQDRKNKITFKADLQDPFRLHQYQAEGAQFAIDKKTALIGYDVGLGKTLTAIAAADKVQDKQKIIMAPNAVLYNWQDEICKFLGEHKNEKIFVMPSSGAKSQKMMKKMMDSGELDKYEYIIMSHEWGMTAAKEMATRKAHEKATNLTANTEAGALFEIASELNDTSQPTQLEIERDLIMRKLTKGKVMILDEAHAFKNPQSKRTRGINDISPESEYRWLLTATPVPNRTEEGFTMIGHVLGEQGLAKLFGKPNSATLERDWRDMVKRYNNATDPVTKKHAADEITKVWNVMHKAFLKYALHKTYTSPDVSATLPAHTRSMPLLSPIGKQREIISILMDKMSGAVRAMDMGDEKLASSASKNAFILSQLTRVNQAGIDPQLVSSTYDNVRDGNVKYEYTRDVLKTHFAAGHHDGSGVVVFCDYAEAFPNMVDYVLKKNAMEGNTDLKAEDIAIYSGKLNAEKKAQMVKDFNSGKIKVMLLTKAGEEGINLQTNCHTHIDLDVPWTPKSYAQREGRILRQGQKKQVQFHRPMIRNLGEQRRAMLLMKKLETNEGLLRHDNFDKLARGERIESSSELDLKDLAMLSGTKIPETAWKHKSESGETVYNLGAGQTSKTLPNYAKEYGVGKSRSFNDEAFNYSWHQMMRTFKNPEKLHALIKNTELKMFVRAKVTNAPLVDSAYQGMYMPMDNRLAITNESLHSLSHEICHFMVAKTPQGSTVKKAFAKAVQDTGTLNSMGTRVLKQAGEDYATYAMNSDELLSRYFEQYMANRHNEMGRGDVPSLFVPDNVVSPLTRSAEYFTDEEFEKLRPAFETAMQEWNNGESMFAPAGLPAVVRKTDDAIRKSMRPHLFVLQKSSFNDAHMGTTGGLSLGAIRQHKDGYYYEKTAPDKWRRLTKDKGQVDKYSERKTKTGEEPTAHKGKVSIGAKVRIDPTHKGSGKGIMAVVHDVINEGGKAIARLRDNSGNFYRAPVAALAMAKSRKTKMSIEIERGSKIEAEHDDVHDDIDNSVKKTGDVPSKYVIRKKIAEGHVKGHGEGEKPNPRYYKQLKGMESLNDVKGMDKKIIEFLRGYNGKKVSDKMMHEFAETNGYDVHEVESRVYTMLSKVV